jgi:membrane protein involved in colicin uptake
MSTSITTPAATTGVNGMTPRVVKALAAAQGKLASDTHTDTDTGVVAGVTATEARTKPTRPASVSATGRGADTTRAKVTPAARAKTPAPVPAKTAREKTAVAPKAAAAAGGTARATATTGRRTSTTSTNTGADRPTPAGDGSGGGSGARPAAQRGNGAHSANRAPSATRGGTGAGVEIIRLARLGPGQLRQLIAEHLQADPSLEFTPTELGNKLGRSSGAIANALATLCEHGEAVQTLASPKTYRTTQTPPPRRAGRGGTAKARR